MKHFLISFFVFLKKYAEKHLLKISEEKVKDSEKLIVLNEIAVAKTDIKTFNTSFGNIILLPNEKCPQKLFELLGNTEKLSTAISNMNNAFTLTGISYAPTVKQVEEVHHSNFNPIVIENTENESSETYESATRDFLYDDEISD